jgi:hypothetical protein
MAHTRIFIAELAKNLPFFLSLILGTMGLSGCQYQFTDPPFEKKTYELDHHQTTITIHFIPKTGAINDADLEEVQRLLHPGGLGKVSVHVTIPSPKTASQNKKVHALKKALLKLGLKDLRLHVQAAPLAITPNTVEIALDTYRAIPPVCGDWHFPMGEARGAMIPPNFGCAEAHNFIVMLEDPKVLWQGAPLDSRDTNYETAVIRKYKSGKPLALKGDKGSETESSKEESYGSEKSSSNG